MFCLLELNITKILTKSSKEKEKVKKKKEEATITEKLPHQKH